MIHRNEEKLTEALKQVRTLSQQNQELVGERYNRGKVYAYPSQ
jgi:hypothetical protein